jgi:hypothetical protein
MLAIATTSFLPLREKDRMGKRPVPHDLSAAIDDNGAQPLFFAPRSLMPALGGHQAGVADRGNIFLVLAALEHRGPCHENICAGGGESRRGLRRDAAIHLKVDVASVDHRPDAPNLLDLRWNESLAAEARVYAHHEDQVDSVEDVLDDVFWCARIKRNACFLTERADLLKRPVEMRPRFGMDGNDVRACLCERLKIRVRRLDHEMNIEGLLRPRADAFDEARPKRDVGHEMAVHDVDMNPVTSGLVDRSDLLAEAGEIGR